MKQMNCTEVQIVRFYFVFAVLVSLFVPFFCFLERIVLAGNVSEIEVEIMNADGLHMRPAMQFVDIATRFDSDISVTNGETTVDAKSIMQMTMLAATCGTRLTIIAKGVDSPAAIEELQALVEVRMFDEPGVKTD